MTLTRKQTNSFDDSNFDYHCRIKELAEYENSLNVQVKTQRNIANGFESTYRFCDKDFNYMLIYVSKRYLSL